MLSHTPLWLDHFYLWWLHVRHCVLCRAFISTTGLGSSGDSWPIHWSLLGLITERPVVNEAASEFDLANEEMIDGTNRLLKVITGMWLVEECRREWASQGIVYSNEELANLAESSGDVESIIDVNAQQFVAPGTTPDKMTDRVKTFCSSHGLAVPTKHTEIMSTVIQSIAAAYAQAIHNIEQAAGVKIERICVIGGGSQNRMLNRLTEQATALPLVLGPSEATALGNILVQMEATGDGSSPDKLRRDFPLRDAAL
jgi:rhamnulokinase